MAQVWLRTNRRAVAFGMVLPLLVLLLGAALATGFFGLTSNGWLRAAGLLLGSLASVVLVVFAWQMIQPRLVCRDGKVWFFLRAAQGIGVPLEFVEGFLLGQGPSSLPGRQHAESETVTLVVRLSQRASEFEHLEVHPALGSWCDHYVTIRGTWCEPLSVAKVNDLNAQLAAARAQLAERST